MLGAVARLVGSTLIVAAIAVCICVVVALLFGDDFSSTLQIALWSLALVLALFGGVGLAPRETADRALIASGRARLGWVIEPWGDGDGRPGTRVSATAISLLAALVLFGLGIALGA
jgi:hypothetical protein